MLHTVLWIDGEMEDISNLLLFQRNIMICVVKEENLILLLMFTCKPKGCFLFLSFLPSQFLLSFLLPPFLPFFLPS